MVIVKIMGGLGNQLFQYAFSQHLKKAGHKIKLDINWFNENPLPHGNGYQLEKIYNINEEYVDKMQVEKFVVDNPPGLKRKFLRLFQKLGLYKPGYIFVAGNQYEFEGYYDKYIRDISKNKDYYVIGYFQNEKWFRSVQYELQQTITIDIDSLDSINKGLINDLKASNSVAIHVRKFSQEGFDWDLDLAYYEKAINIMKNMVESPKFYIFSDDIEWCKKIFSHISATYVNNNTDYDKQYLDMHVMSYCSNIVIANSTYGWWSAWLNPMQNKKNVIAPKVWVEELYNSNPVTKQWIELDN